MHSCLIILNAIDAYILIYSCLPFFLAGVFAQDERSACIYFPIELVKKLQVEA